MTVGEPMSPQSLETGSSLSPRNGRDKTRTRLRFISRFTERGRLERGASAASQHPRPRAAISSDMVTAPARTPPAAALPDHHFLAPARRSWPTVCRSESIPHIEGCEFAATMKHDFDVCFIGSP